MNDSFMVGGAVMPPGFTGKIKDLLFMSKNGTYSLLMMMV